MFSWFQKRPIQKIGFEDILYVLKTPSNFALINTLPVDMQDCLIKGTMRYEIEEKTINDYLNLPAAKYPTIILYGKNSSDMSVDKKEQQLTELGFADVYIYGGGMLEWLLLQDIYGTSEFPTTSTLLDILRYKPHCIFQLPRISN